jgi:membrane protein required for colicin V production
VTAFDYVVFGVMAASLLVGGLRGVVSEMLGLIAWVAAFIAARTWATPAGDLLMAGLDDLLWRQLLGFAAVFIAVLLLFAMVRWLMTLLLKAVGLRPLDRVLGALFGVARGMLVVLALVLLGGLSPLPREQWWRQAMFAAPLETMVLSARPWLPAELAKRIRYR